MLLLFAMSCLLATSLAHPDYSESWTEFKEKFNKQYDTEEEEVQRAVKWLFNTSFSEPVYLRVGFLLAKSIKC